MFALSQSLHAGAFDAQWQAVEKAVSQGLPQTAITNLEPIITAATKAKDWPVAVKAIAKKIALEGVIQGNKPEEKITRLQTAIAAAPAEAQPVMETLLAHWYWQYFMQNRWRFAQRTETAEAPGKDFTTWSLPRLFAEIDAHFQKALTAEKTLKATPIAAWDGLIEKGTMPDAFRPTLYDFIAYEALEFYTSGEQAGAQPEEAFEVAAGSPIFEPAASFMFWGEGPASPDAARKIAAQLDSPKFKAIRLYGKLLQFHKANPQPQTAFAAADLARLNWGWNVAFGEEKNARYKAALERFIKEQADFEISALALEDLARVLQQEGDLVAAHRTAKRGAETFPNSPGGKMCRNLIVELEAKSANITTERVWNCGQNARTTADRQDACPTIAVRYRNVTNVFFRAIPADWESFLDQKRRRPDNLTDKEKREIIARTPALAWSAKLPPTDDFREATFSTPAPTTLKPGFYFIAASHDAQFGDQENLVSLTDVWVSELALVTRPRDKNLEGFVLEAGSGEPVSGAQVNFWHLDQQGKRIPHSPLTTDTNGFFSFKPEPNRGYLIRARHAGRELATENDLAVNDWQWQWRNRDEPQFQTIFFSDRAIYRPGQAIQYKGLVVNVSPKQDTYRVVAGEEVTVVFFDPNNKEIARAKHRANDYGSFAGSFTAPRDRLMGSMRIEAQGRAGGAVMVQVEEYKRPKFEVTLDAPKTAAKLNENVSLTGHATSYTGAAVDGATVKWRVSREARMPWWWGWWGGGWTPSPAREIAHGTARTEADGSFKIEFAARPDAQIPEKNEPTFNFSINADVTDTAGETRSANRDVRVGYTALEATLAADDWQTASAPVELKVSTKTLDGEPQVAEGSVKIYALQAPVSVQRAPLMGQPHRPYQSDQSDQSDNLSDPNNWPLGKVVTERGFTTDTNGAAKLSFTLPVGAFRAVLETQDRFGKKVTGKLPLRVVDPAAAKLAIKIPNLLAAPDWSVEPGQDFMAVWGTGYDTGRAFVEIEHRERMLQRYWTAPGRTQQQIKLAVAEAMRGGFYVHVTFVRENRAYLESRKVEVPWNNKDLELTWAHFVSKLTPGQKETWTLEVRSAKSEVRKAEKAVAELVATLYDESLDAFAPLNWPRGFDFFYEDSTTAQAQFQNFGVSFNHAFGRWDRPGIGVEITYRHFPADLTQNLWGYGFPRRRGAIMFKGTGGVPEPAIENMVALSAPMPMVANSVAPGASDAMLADKPSPITPLPAAKGQFAEAGRGGAGGLLNQAPTPKPDLSKVAARKNLNETAFFYPQLTSDSNGVVRMTFTMPEALTKWRFLGFASDKQVRSGLLEAHAVTAKDLMVQPNAPRFLRDGDTVEFTVKISNQSDKRQTGAVKLSFAEAATSADANKMLSNTKPEQSFDIPAKESRTIAWRITVPDGTPFLTYKAVASTGAISDGEEGYLPVLSRRVFITESLPLWIHGPATKKFEFTKLLKSGGSKTLRSEGLVVQMVSNPAWYAVMALPYLMEYPYQCSEQTFNRFYANTLARFIANSDPKIRSIFDQWKNTPALDSPLEKNQDLKSVMLEETPWFQDGQKESQARKNVGILFDENRLNNESEATLRKLSEMQLGDGRWPWFPGGPGNDYITLYITTGFGRLRHLGVDVDVSPAQRSLARLDQWMKEHHARILKDWRNPEEYVPSSTDALYLYGRSFFLKDAPVAPDCRKAADFFLAQSRQHWLKTDCRQTQGHLAIALSRFNSFNSFNDSTPPSILKSLKERSVTDAELGRFWRDTELSWWWYRAPIETQALMIEAFDEVAKDAAAVEVCRVWLLNQKRTQDWKTTKATADAVYSLLLKGRDLLASTELVRVTLGGVDVTPPLGAEIRNPKSEIRNKSETPNSAEARAKAASSIGNAPEPGTGFYEVRFAPADIKPKLGEITVKKVDQGLAWGGVHWQYLEDISKVTPYVGTPLKLKKSIYTKVNTGKGPVLEPVKGPLAVGDELVVRIELRTDRDMEFVHLKDQRGSGTEPVNVISRYKYQDGLGYYESTRDVASHFFMDYLPKGTYVFE